ncbi:prolyl oligopeptidase family serine peptidase [Asticcacaulis sp.]|uniref:alpha/beta hydrolase n=1 Tax=Asticcacaulis sp. TaxID=1872648 RepID=UPI002619E4DE|nr:prolyl oligopeptidase family serine peptidase [Asticcacaulis sp.]
MSLVAPSVPPEADEIITLSEGPQNVLEGEWPERRYYTINRLELARFAAKGRPQGRALVYPGGGYLDLVHDKEGIDIALWLSNIGIEAFVVTHRLPGAKSPDGVWPFDIALKDGRRCLDYLQSLDPLPLFHVGLSSGGHLAAVMTCQAHPLAPAGVIIAYAPINANARFYKAPAGKPDYPPQEKQAFYDAWPIGIEQEPHAIPPVPVFVAYALHDKPVPVDHALNLVRTMHKMGGRVDAHIFAQAPHGFALRDKAGTHAVWAKLAENWLARTIEEAL